ncbi:MAG: flagellar basal body protein [Gemmatimonadaceae bacterium]|nr:flagellar basal body protein [Gemmatimonadaceae bacterium]
MPPILKNSGLTSAAAALHFYERRQQVIANNLANVDTTGFKKERVFGRIVDDAVAAAERDHRSLPGRHHAHRQRVRHRRAERCLPRGADARW